MIKRPENVVYLRIYTWQGMSLGAQHWYAELDMRGASAVKVKGPLTQQHATIVNKDLRRQGYSMRYKRGYMYDGFLEWEEAANRGIEQWQEVFPGTDVLLLGRASSGSPMPIIAAPEGVDIEALNALTAKCEEMGWYKARYERGADDHNDLLDEISDEWFALVNAGLQTG